MPMFVGFQTNAFLVSIHAVNCQNFLVANASVKNMEVVRDQIKVLGRIPPQ